MKQVIGMSFLMVIGFLAVSEQGKRQVIELRAELRAALAAETSRTDKPLSEAPSSGRESEPVVQESEITLPGDLGLIGAIEAPLSKWLVTTMGKAVPLPYGTIMLNAGVPVTLVQDRGTEVDVLWQEKLVTLSRTGVRSVNGLDIESEKTESPAVVSAEASVPLKTSYTMSPLASFGNTTLDRTSPMNRISADYGYENRRVWNTYDGRFYPYPFYYPSTSYNYYYGSRVSCRSTAGPVADSMASARASTSCNSPTSRATSNSGRVGMFRRSGMTSVSPVSSNTSPVRVSTTSQCQTRPSITARITGTTVRTTVAPRGSVR